jgi:hypothetical protein
MVRLNSEGLNVPVSWEELKNLPLIPGSAVEKRRASLGSQSEIEPAVKSQKTTILESHADDTTTVFDLVHRGRQR